MQELRTLDASVGNHKHPDATGSSIVDGFSLIEGGPIYRFQRAIRMAMPDRSGVAKRALLTILVTWIPLLLLALLQGRAFGSQVRIPLLKDIGANIRLLLGIPLLVIAEVVIDPRLNHCVRHFVKSGLVDSAELPAFETVIARTMRLRNAVLPTIL